MTKTTTTTTITKMTMIRFLLYALVLVLWPTSSTTTSCRSCCWGVLGGSTDPPPTPPPSSKPKTSTPGGKGGGGGQPLKRLQVTLQGEIYYVSDVTTVVELQQRLWEESGLEESEQGRVTFQGQVLESHDQLDEVGIQDGNQINMVPSKIADQWKLSKDMGEGLIKLQSKINRWNYHHPTFSTKTSLSRFGLPGSSSSNSNKSSPKKTTTTTPTTTSKITRNTLVKEFHILSELYTNLMTKVPYMYEEMEEFSKRLQNPDTLQHATDPERIESLRQIILNNPMLLSHVISSSTTAKDALQDGTSWYNMIYKSIQRWKTMTGYQLWQQLVHGTLLFETNKEEENDK